MTSTTLSTATIQIGNFINPPTTKDVQGLQAFLVDNTGNAKAVKQDGYITGLTPARMSVAALVPSSAVVGATGLTLTVSFTTVSPFKTGYELQLVMPSWNTNAGAVNPP